MSDFDPAALAVYVTHPAGSQPPEAGAVATFTYRPDPDRWEASGDVRRGAAGLAIGRLEIRTADPAGNGVSVRVMRQLQIGELLTAVRARIGSDRMPDSPAKGDCEIPETSGRTILTDGLLHAVAVAYLEETSPGKDRRAIQRLAVRFNRPEGTVKTWLSRARRDGWLGPGSKGRIGAEPGPRLLVHAGVVACGTCHGEPPAGFACRNCGVEGGSDD